MKENQPKNALELSEEERQEIEDAVDFLQEQLNGTQTDLILAGIDKLGKSAQNFMQRRMSMALREAVKKKEPIK